MHYVLRSGSVELRSEPPSSFQCVTLVSAFINKVCNWFGDSGRNAVSNCCYNAGSCAIGFIFIFIDI